MASYSILNHPNYNCDLKKWGKDVKKEEFIIDFKPIRHINISERKENVLYFVYGTNSFSMGGKIVIRVIILLMLTFLSWLPHSGWLL